MVILGVNAYHPDSSAALVVDGKLIAACEEERFRRIKHYSGFPGEAIKSCLKEAGISLKEIDYIAFPRQNKARLLKKIAYGIKIPSLAKKRLEAWGKARDVKAMLCRLFEADSGIKAKVVKVEHHLAHLACSFFASGFDKAFLLSCDALGDFASTMWGIGEGGKIKVLGEVSFPHSLGFYYTALTQYLGFLKFGDEYKVMGLAPYGEDSFAKEFEDILKIRKGGFELGLDYFLHHKKYIDMNFEEGYPQIDLLFSRYLEKKLGRRRNSGEPITQRHKNIAFSLQKRLEDVLYDLINKVSPGKYQNLCLTGGVSHNCAAAGKIPDRTYFKNIYVPPAPGDAGLAVGAAFYFWHKVIKNKSYFKMSHAYLGPFFEQNVIIQELKKRKPELNKGRFSVKEMKNRDCLCRYVAKSISDGKIAGWFQGRMEFGPRALGNRSILADPRKKEIKDILNERIKQREPFRPFAPSILEEYVADYFEKENPSPFMSFIYKVKEEKKNQIPAVCHVDGTARLQTVNKEDNPLYWQLINEFYKITGVPALLNTSFNENEPIVNLPFEAVDCFLRTHMDMLVLGNLVIERGSLG